MSPSPNRALDVLATALHALYTENYIVRGFSFCTWREWVVVDSITYYSYRPRMHGHRPPKPKLRCFVYPTRRAANFLFRRMYACTPQRLDDLKNKKQSNTMLVKFVLADRSGVVQIHGAFPAPGSFTEALLRPYGGRGLDCCLSFNLVQHSLGQQFAPVIWVRSGLFLRGPGPCGEKNR